MLMEQKNMVIPKGVARVQEALDTEKKLALGFWKLSVIGHNLYPRDWGESW